MIFIFYSYTPSAPVLALCQILDPIVALEPSPVLFPGVLLVNVT